MLINRQISRQNEMLTERLSNRVGEIQSDLPQSSRS